MQRPLVRSKLPIGNPIVGYFIGEISRVLFLKFINILQYRVVLDIEMLKEHLSPLLSIQGQFMSKIFGWSITSNQYKEIRGSVKFNHYIVNNFSLFSQFYDVTQTAQMRLLKKLWKMPMYFSRFLQRISVFSARRRLLKLNKQWVCFIC